MPSGVLGAVTQLAYGIGQVDPTLGAEVAQVSGDLGRGALTVSVNASPPNALQNLTGLSTGALLLIFALVLLAFYFILRS